MTGTIRVASKKPGESWKIRNIENTIAALNEFVEGYIETVALSDTAVIIRDDEGKIKGKPFNCKIGRNSFYGNIIIAGVDGEEFTDLPHLPDTGHKEGMQ